jgi:hypothetical protein
MLNYEKYLSHYDIATVIKKITVKITVIATLTATLYFAHTYGESHVYFTISEYHNNLLS